MRDGARRETGLLGVEPGEGRLLVAGAAALFLVEWASVSATNVAETFFLKRVGVDRLPLVFLLNALLLTGTSLAVGRVAARVDQRALLVAVLGGLGLVLLPLWILVATGVTSVFVLLVIAAKQIDAIAQLVFWTAVGGLVTGRQGKRLFAPITAGGTLGTICGSFASAPIARAIGIPALLPIAAALLGAAALVTLGLARRLPGVVRRVGTAQSREAERLGRLGALWKEGWLFRVLVLSALCAGALGPMLYFQFSYVADQATAGSGGEQRLLDLYAVIRGWINVGVLAIQVVGTAALFRWIGVPLAATLSPIIYLLGLIGLCVRTSLAAGVGAMAGATLQDHAVYDPAQRILVTLFPERLRTTVTTLVEGPVKRAGAVAGNLVVIGILSVGAPTWVGWIGLPVATVWLVLAVVLWRGYPTLLLEVASAERGPQSRVPAGAFVDGATLRAIRRTLGGSDVERCRAACALAVEMPPPRAVEALAGALWSAPARNHHLLVDALDRILENHPVTSVPAARAVARLVGNPEGIDAGDRANLVQAYARLLGSAAGEWEHRGLLDLAARDESEAVRVAARAALGRLEGGGDLEGLLDEAFASPDPATRHVAREETRTELLRAGSDPRSGPGAHHAGRLVAQLASAHDRPQVALALADVAERHAAHAAAWAPALFAHRDDADVRVRIAVLRVAGAAGFAEAAPWAATRLAAADPAEAAAAEDALARLGPTAVAPLHRMLRMGGLAARRRAVAILRGMPDGLRTVDMLIGREVETGLRLVVRTDVLAAGGAAEVAVRRLRERIDECAHTALLLLAAAVGDERIARVGYLLARAGRRERAVLLEALESVLPPGESEQLLVLLEDARPELAAARAAALLRSQPPTFEEALVDVATDGDRLTAALLVATLDGSTRRALEARLDGVRVRVSYDAEAATVARDIDTILHLRSLDLFDRLTTGQLAELAGLVEEVTLAAGVTIMREGEFDDCVYFIVHGRVRVTKADVVLNELGPREFFGEMALVDGETRSATVATVGRVQLLRLTRAAFLQAMEEHPAIAVAVCQTLSRRVRDLLEDRARLEGRRAGPDEGH